MRGSNNVGGPGPPLKRSRVASEGNNGLNDANEDRVKMQPFSTARDEYVSDRISILWTFHALLCPGQAAAAQIWWT